MIKQIIMSALVLTALPVFGDIAVLPPELAFPMNMDCADEVCTINIQPKKNYFVYSDIDVRHTQSINFSVVGMIHVPKKGETLYDEHKKVKMYSSMKIIFKQPNVSEITLTYRGCNAESFCYSKMTRTFKVNP